MDKLNCLKAVLKLRGSNEVQAFKEQLKSLGVATDLLNDSPFVDIPLEIACVKGNTFLDNAFEKVCINHSIYSNYIVRDHLTTVLYVLTQMQNDTDAGVTADQEKLGQAITIVKSALDFQAKTTIGTITFRYFTIE